MLLDPKSRIGEPHGRRMTKNFRTIKFRIVPLTPNLWPALEDLFGKWGASNGCWCMYWRIGGAYRGRCGENREKLLDRPARTQGDALAIDTADEVT
jgi:hypothetical protein